MDETKKNDKVLEENEQEVAPLPPNLLYQRIKKEKYINKNDVLNRKCAESKRVAKRRAKNKRAKLSRKKNRK